MKRTNVEYVRNEIIVTRRGTFSRWKERKGHLRRCIRWMLSYPRKTDATWTAIGNVPGTFTTNPSCRGDSIRLSLFHFSVIFPACFTVERVLFFNDSSMREKLVGLQAFTKFYIFFFYEIVVRFVCQTFRASSNILRTFRRFLEFLVTYQDF